MFCFLYSRWCFIKNTRQKEMTQLWWCAGEKESKRNEQATPRREDQLAHINMEMAPPSPSPGPSTSTTESSAVTIPRENSSACIAHLPPDTQKFLKFAGILIFGLLSFTTGLSYYSWAFVSLPEFLWFDCLFFFRVVCIIFSSWLVLMYF